MNKTIRRRVLCAAVALAATTALPFASSPVFAQSAGKPKVVLVMKSLANEFFLTMENGAKDYQKHNTGQFDLITNGIKDETDTAAQIRIVEQMIVSKVDALVIAPADSKALVPVIKKAADAGNIVVNIDNRLDPDVLKSKDLNVPFVGPDNKKGARKVGDYLAKRLTKGDEVAIIEGVTTTTNSQMRSAGFKDAMDAAGMKVVALQSGEWEIDKGNAVALQILNANPNVKTLLCDNDNMAIGAVSAVRACGGQGAGRRLRQHQRDQADVERWPRVRHRRPVRGEAGRVRHRRGVEGHQGAQEAIGPVDGRENAGRSRDEGGCRQISPARCVKKRVEPGRERPFSSSRPFCR